MTPKFLRLDETRVINLSHVVLVTYESGTLTIETQGGLLIEFTSAEAPYLWGRFCALAGSWESVQLYQQNLAENS